jgi:[NiFe] hydrogenase diaphorase moiety large subunit
MLFTEHERLRAELSGIAEEHSRMRSALIPMLHHVQRERACISQDAMQVIADLLDIHPVEVHGVVTFYSFFNEEPKGRFIIRLCRTISCDMVGKGRVARQLESDLGIRFGETTADGKFTLEWTNCMGQCDLGPALLVNEEVHTRVTPEDAHRILAECRSTFGAHAQQRKELHSL